LLDFELAGTPLEAGLFFELTNGRHSDISLASMLSHYSRLFGGPFAGHDETHLRELSMRMKDIPENRHGRPQQG